MKHWYKPLAFYAAMEVAALLCSIALQAAGFQRHVWMGLAYYTRNMPAQPPIRHSIDVPAGAHAGSRSSSGSWRTRQAAALPQAQQQQHRSSSTQQQVPLVLLHGIGMGLIPYISMLFNMAATGESWLTGVCLRHARASLCSPWCVCSHCTATRVHCASARPSHVRLAVLAAGFKVLCMNT